VTRLRLLLRNILYFRGVSLAVILGMAVATAVLSGAMMVGDSVRASLRELTLQRFGKIDDAIIATRFFDASLASRIAAADPNVELAPTVLVTGAASDESTGAHTADVQIASGAWIDVPPGKCAINGDLADALGVKAPGETIVLSFPSDSDAPREAALDRRARADTISELRVDVSEIVREPGVASMFNPTAGQRGTRNAWVNLAELQNELDQSGRVNALLAHEKAEKPDDLRVKALNDALAQVIALSDYGLTTKKVVNGSRLAIGSRSTYLIPSIVDAADALAARLKIPLQKISVNLLTSIKAPPNGKVMHYAVVAGLSDVDGQTLGANETDINEETANRLGIKAGDSLQLDFYERGADGQLHDASASHAASDLTFRIARVLPMSGIGADPQLTPDYKGLTDANSVADWNPPEGLKIDKSLVTKDDEAYWQKYRAAPKIFVSFDTAAKLWGSLYGQVTGMRIPAEESDAFLDALRLQISPASMQMTFRPIKAEQLAAAGGGTDFSEYFLYFSFFLIVAAVLLVAMLFRLGIEQRARQLGLLSAVGFAPGAIQRLALGEGLVLAAIGGILGSLAGIGYTWLIMAGLRTWWIGAVGTTALRLHVVPMTLAVGFIAGVIVAMLAVWWGAWRVGRTQVARLLAGSWEKEAGRKRRGGRVLRIVGILFVVSGAGALVMAAVEHKGADEAFLAGGSLLLFGALIWLAGALRPRAASPWHGRPAHVSGAEFQKLSTGKYPRSQHGVAAATATKKVPTITSVPRLGIRNASRHTARSVLAVGLIAFAVFTLIVVAVMRQGSAAPSDDKQSGTGGYRLILQAAIPIFGDLNTVEGRKLAGVRNPKDPLWSNAEFTPMRRWAGQDISCLNLMRPTAPTILSVPPKMVQRGAFKFASKFGVAENPWTLLDSDRGDAIPVIADDDTAEYILHLHVGEQYPITDQLGRSRQLILVGRISGSIFQGELLMGENNFRKLFPSTGGVGLMLIDCKPEDESALRKRLGSELDEYSVSVDTTAGRLAMYKSVENTYMATFQTLGSLGLLLGTIGLAVVLVRTVLERKAELALLSCLGFSPAARMLLVLGENAFLLLLGLGIGAVSALIGVSPALAASGRSMNLTGLVLTLIAVVVVGLVSSSLAVLISGTNVSPADLRRE
jgi:ABC-type lipoprotein release transport system permease subunit